MKIQSRLANINEDLEEIVRIHINAFPGFFMTAMGLSFLREYYRTVLEFPQNIALVAIEADCPQDKTQTHRVVGFVVGFGNPPAFYSFYKTKRLRLFAIILWAVARNPSLLRRVILNLKRISSVEGSNAEVELSSIGVDTDFMKLGVGRVLVRAFLSAASERGYQSVYLTTDACENDRVNQFYQKQNFTLERTFQSGNRQMNLYRIVV
ncbi:GNAT family N-acetyltransferase [Candidatus Gracilibacteria bacterium]|nr:GNAT family N-acetyltransferase [Candidatus Gracilibacteria bacterium]NJM87058.1 GNAT family N-acetyltransferase [Hydrococcus sp. RU_2_2]NJP18374.1 GNAT family N-acetyltransferase [Hydrococcus sp. CRU_1_1]